MKHSYEAKKELYSAIGKIKAASEELENTSLSDDEKFEIAWCLGYVDLRDLENYRTPEQY